jgi:hypothetical protein
LIRNELSQKNPSFFRNYEDALRKPPGVIMFKMREKTIKKRKKDFKKEFAQNN